MPIDVRDEHLVLIKQILNRIVPDRRVVAFGSRVKYQAKKTSDLDLCIIGDEPLSFETLAALRDEFSYSSIPYKIDVVDWASLERDFQTIINEQYEVINP